MGGEEGLETGGREGAGRVPFGARGADRVLITPGAQCWLEKEAGVTQGETAGALTQGSQVLRQKEEL